LNHYQKMKIEKTKMIMKYFDVTYKVAKQYEILLKDKQLQQIKAWYEDKKDTGLSTSPEKSADGSIGQRDRFSEKIG